MGQLSLFQKGLNYIPETYVAAQDSAMYSTAESPAARPQ